MNDNFDEVMANLSDEELLKVIEQKDGYQPEAYRSAELEASKRKAFKEKLNALSNEEVLNILKTKENHPTNETEYALSVAKTRNIIQEKINSKPYNKQSTLFSDILLIVGIVLGVYAFFMDTSVSVSGFSQRINNIGLMADKQNYLVVAGILIIAGAIMRVSKKKKDENYEDQELIKKCPQCAEGVKMEAKICRFCSYKFSD
jgi:hypothetical protein